jgi:hypothetical protein
VRALATAALLLALAPTRGHAHGMRSAYLEVSELAGHRALMRLSTTVPSSGLKVVVPAGCRAEDEEASPLVLDCDGPLAGRTLRVDGLGPIVSEVVVRVENQDSAPRSRILTAEAPEWTLPREERPARVLVDYARLGIWHIFTGWDHLLFLAALAVALRRLRAILLAETAFTLSHTLTFTASALGLLHVSSAAAEACIALSLVLIALDAARSAAGIAPGSATRQAALLAFVFGLVHGLGFAGGLAEIGVPDRAIGVALAGFALGVESGQVLFLVLLYLVLWLATRSPRLRLVPQIIAYAVGSAGVFLLLQRLVVVFSRRSA